MSLGILMSYLATVKNPLIHSRVQIQFGANSLLVAMTINSSLYLLDIDDLYTKHDSVKIRGATKVGESWLKSYGHVV